MQLLVTGAGGLVGAGLVEGAVSNGWRVTAFDRAEPPPELRQAWRAGPGSTVFVQGDIRDEKVLDLALHGGLDCVVHAATVTSGAARDAETPAFVMDVNILGTIAMLSAARRASVKRFVYVSSNAVYGANAQSWPLLDEATTVCDPRSLYGISKFAAERTVLRLGELWDMDVRIARLSSVFGPWERDTGVRDTLNPMLQVTLAAIRSDEAVLQRSCRRDWIYSRDVASALIELTRSQRLNHVIYNVGPGPKRSWTVEDWCARLFRAFPQFRYRIAQLGERPNINLHEPADRAPLNTERLFADTDFRPAFGLEEAFEDMIRWRDQNPAVWQVI